jgi:hypothetical protein
MFIQILIFIAIYIIRLYNSLINNITHDKTITHDSKLARLLYIENHA